MKLKRFFTILAVVLLIGTNAFAQVSSNLTGRVTMDGNPLPGVTVTISSPALQGTRSAVTDVNGNYNFAALPPGDYTVRFEMESMQTVTRTQRIGLGQTGRADAELQLTAVAEAITVTASAPPVLETTEVQSNYTREFVDDLPIPRTFQAQAALAPNVTTNSPSGAQLIISGAPAHENLYMVNGAVINENLRGQIHNLFIEDAIQETTVLTGGISAEYGRFTGGVVNSITKSGGNEFSGSFRDSLTNPSWTAMSYEDQPDFSDTLNEVYEATFGGRIIQDRLWFFTAGRYTETAQDQFLHGTDIPFTFTNEETRLEAKLTGQITPRHSLQGSYLDVSNPQSNICFGGCYETSNIDNARELPLSFLSGHYSGIFTSNLLGEVNYSQKRFAFNESGGDFTDRARGTWGFDPNEFAFFGAPVFCGICGAEERNNDYLEAKLTYYLASRRLGTHNISGGYQDWAEERISNNYQSGSNFGIYVLNAQSPMSGSGNVFRPHIVPGEALISYWPILELTQGSNFATQSLYVNDKWDLNTRWQFNLGLRYDRNDGKDASGVTRAKDSLISPRIGAMYDIFGNGRLRLNASYGSYTAKIAETIGGGASPAGNPAYVFWVYAGPEISGLPTAEAFTRLFTWFDSVGGIDNDEFLIAAGFPGVNVQIAEGLESPKVDEITLGAGLQIGRGFARVDLISRDWANFYAQQTIGGTVLDPFGNRSDLQTIYTDNDFYERMYRGASLQASYPLGSQFQIGGNYTWSETRGNVTAETRDNGPITETHFLYPEFKNFEQNAPSGYLPQDQRHKGRLWAMWTLPTPVGNFTLSALQRYDSGTAYSAIGLIDPSAYLSDDVLDLYSNRPTTVNYFFGDRGAFRFDDVSALDVTINYRLRLGAAELFIQPELINVFNENAVINGSTAVQVIQPFNPFTETPVEGVHYELPETFGQARNALDYQLGRTFRISAGIRF